jgi:AbrB family looped-hinge helix DNA binding protein
MSDAIEDAMTVIMDASGRLVIPKAIREEAGFAAGAPLRISVRDGRIEIEPTYAKIRIVQKDGFAVAELVDPQPSLPQIPESEYRRLKWQDRERRKKWS